MKYPLPTLLLPPPQYIGSRNTSDFHESWDDFQEGRNGPLRLQPTCVASLSFEPHIPNSELRGE